MSLFINDTNGQCFREETGYRLIYSFIHPQKKNMRGDLRRVSVIHGAGGMCVVHECGGAVGLGSDSVVRPSGTLEGSVGSTGAEKVAPTPVVCWCIHRFWADSSDGAIVPTTVTVFSWIFLVPFLAFLLRILANSRIHVADDAADDNDDTNDGGDFDGSLGPVSILYTNIFAKCHTPLA